MSALSKDAIFAHNDRPTEEFAVPEWGGAVLLRPLSLDQLLVLTEVPETAGRAEKSVLRFGLVDADGVPCYSTEDVQQLYATKRPDVLNRIVARVNEISGFAKPESDAGK